MKGFKYFLDGGIGTYVPPLPLQEDLIWCTDQGLLKLFIFVIEFTSYLNNFKSQEKLGKLKVNSKDKTLGNNHDIFSIAIKNEDKSKIKFKNRFRKINKKLPEKNSPLSPPWSIPFSP